MANGPRTRVISSGDEVIQPPEADVPEIVTAEDLVEQVVIADGEPAPPDADMADAPRDGSRVWLQYDDGSYVEAYWRSTRRLVNRRWVPFAFWAKWMTCEPIPFDPVSWLEAK